MAMSVGVSFARVPLDEISQLVAKIEALGWRERGRGDPWVVSFGKQIPEETMQAASDGLREVVGEYWVDADEIKDLLRRADADTDA